MMSWLPWKRFLWFYLSKVFQGHNNINHELHSAKEGTFPRHRWQVWGPEWWLALVEWCRVMYPKVKQWKPRGQKVLESTWKLQSFKWGEERSVEMERSPFSPPASLLPWDLFSSCDVLYVPVIHLLPNLFFSWNNQKHSLIPILKSYT